MVEFKTYGPPATTIPNLGGSGTGHAQACAADHAVMDERVKYIETVVASMATPVIGALYHGNGPPTDSIGNDGDLYLDTASADLYEKTNGTWF